MVDLVLITGGNIGDITNNLECARLMLIQELGPQVACSSVMTSEAWGFEAKEQFLNQVVVINTSLSPQAVLAICHKIECLLGRVREMKITDTSDQFDVAAAIHKIPRYISRSMDVDILFYGDQVVNDDNLIIPHLHIAEREFVLRPLNEVIPQFLHPVTGESVDSMLQRLMK